METYRLGPVCFLLSLLFKVAATNAQTTQPFLFAGTNDNTGRPSGFATLLRNGSTGALSLLPNTGVTFKDGCNPTAMDPTGHFLFAACGEGIVMFTLDTTTGIVAETATSPYFASVSTGQSGILVIPESTGQYVYLLKATAATPGLPSSLTLDSFRIDAVTPSLVAANSLPLSLDGSRVYVAADPGRHGFFIYVNQTQGAAPPAALLYAISFDPSTGEAAVPTSGLKIGNNARSMAMSPAGTYLALGWGDTEGSLTIYQLSPASLDLALVGTANLGPEDGTYGHYTFPDSLFFSPGGNLLYAPAPPADFSGGALPFLVFDPAQVAPIATPPIRTQDAPFVDGLADPQAPFSYVGNSGPAAFGISVFQVDLSTGLASQPTPISAPFFPQMWITPIFAPVTSAVQGIEGPTLGISPNALTFGPINVGQGSTAQNVVLKSLGNQSTSLSSIQISGANPGDFKETDNCTSSPVLPTNHSCTIAVSYVPSATGASQATLVIIDNAAGSPQEIPLSGIANASPVPVPAVSLSPTSALNFAGTPTQGTSTLPQNVVLTNSGNAPLQVSGIALSGVNAGDFSLTSNTCSAVLAAGATCTVSIVFSPLATGIRMTTLVFTDNASNSPQSVALSGTAVAAASFAAAPNSAMSVSVTAGQSAQFNLQALPGTGFNGTLSFTCSGAPFGATCTVPSSISITNGTPATFTVSVSTLGASQTPPTLTVPSSPSSPGIPLAMLSILAVACALLLWTQFERSSRHLPSAVCAAAFSMILAFSGIGCGGVGGGGGSGGGAPASPPPAPQSAATPAIQPSAGTFGSAQSISISDTTPASTIYYTTDGSTPTTASPVYAGAFSLSSTATVQAMAAAPGYSNSPLSSALFKFRTPAATYSITITVSATPAGSSKTLQLSPILLTLTVN